MPIYPLRASLTYVLLLLLSVSGGCGYPNDMENSLETIRDGTLHVGITENPPWVTQENDAARGLETELIRSLAGQLNAEVQWHWGTESEIIEALEQRQIHLAAGGFKQSSHLKKRVALTKPYFTSRNRVGFPADSTLPTDLASVPVATRQLEGLSKLLESKGAQPRLVRQLHNQELPIATAEWRLKAYERLIGPWVLSTDKHVLALPKGENAWMMVVQRHLNNSGALPRRLVALEQKAPQ